MTKRLMVLSVMLSGLVVAVAQAAPPDVVGRRPHAGRGEPRGGDRPDMGMRAGRPEWMLDRLLKSAEMVEELGLSKEQVERLQTAAYELQKEMVEKRAAMEVAAMEQAKLLKDESSTEEALLAAVEKTGHLRIEMAKLGMKRLLLIRNELSAEQREKLRHLVHKHMREHHRRAEAMRRQGMRDDEGVQERQERRERMEQWKRGEQRDAPRGNRPRRRPTPEDEA